MPLTKLFDGGIDRGTAINTSVTTQANDNLIITIPPYTQLEIQQWGALLLMNTVAGLTGYFVVYYSQPLFARATGFSIAKSVGKAGLLGIYVARGCRLPRPQVQVWRE